MNGTHRALSSPHVTTFEASLAGSAGTLLVGSCWMSWTSQHVQLVNLVGVGGFA